MLNEAASKSLTRVLGHFENNAFSIVSASRGIYGKEENKIRTENLISDVRGGGFGFVKMKGRYVEGYGTEGEKNPVQEDVLFIASKPMKVNTETTPEDESRHNDEVNSKWNEEFKQNMMKLGNKYDQESIVFKPYGEEKAYLIGTVDIDENGKKVWPGHGNMIEVGDIHPGKAGMFHTMLWKNKRTFTFESVEYPKSFMGSWSEFLHRKAINEGRA